MAFSEMRLHYVPRHCPPRLICQIASRLILLRKYLAVEFPTVFMPERHLPCGNILSSIYLRLVHLHCLTRWLFSSANWAKTRKGDHGLAS